MVYKNGKEIYMKIKSMNNISRCPLWIHMTTDLHGSSPDRIFKPKHICIKHK